MLKYRLFTLCTRCFQEMKDVLKLTDQMPLREKTKCDICGRKSYGCTAKGEYETIERD